jgi:LmbE family N-acetylglucosaminyl deacetylase
MAITEEKEPAPELATLVLSVPLERVGELKAIATYKEAVARANANEYESRRQPELMEHWRKEEAFWANIREQLNK